MCALCGKINQHYLCDQCEDRIKEIEHVHKDKHTSKEYNEHIYLFKYKEIRDYILSYKFNDKPYYYKTFSQILLKNEKICAFLKFYDIIIPVPIHNKRRKERGYNQTELIAKEIAKNTYELEYCNILNKVKNTVPQSTLNKKERVANSKNVYKINEDLHQSIFDKRVLIFDDIYTTGTTVNECAKVIKTLQPKKVGILTIAKD